MYSSGIPDLTANTQLSRIMSRVNQDLARSAGELTTGKSANLVKASGGDPARIYGLERELSLIEGRLQSINLAAGRASTTQNALGLVRDAVGVAGAKLAGSVALGDLKSSETIASEARSAFEQAISALNTRYGDRALFAGAASDGPATAPAGDILADIGALVSGAADAGAVITAIDDYFNLPGGFDTTGYLGSAADAPQAELAPGERISFAVRADDQAIRQTLAALAKTVIGAEAGFAGATRDERLSLLGSASNQGILANDNLIKVEAKLGVAEERFEAALTRFEAEESFLGQALNRLTQKDQFEAATEFTALETQLQTVFSVTARLSSLTLTNFLR